jgi:predicted NUDIX family phosphoesterase
MMTPPVSRNTPILVIPRATLPPLPGRGAWAWADWPLPSDWTWLPRQQAETDEGYLQLIPYVLLQNARGDLWHYRRTGGDARLRERLSAGVGGHIEAGDGEHDLLPIAAATARRELREELGEAGNLKMPAPVAWLYEGESAIGRVHIGWLYVLPWTADEDPLPRPGEPLENRGFIAPESIPDDPRFELWSRLAARFLLEQSS